MEQPAGVSDCRRRAAAQARTRPAGAAQRRGPHLHPRHKAPPPRLLGQAVHAGPLPPRPLQQLLLRRAGQAAAAAAALLVPQLLQVLPHVQPLPKHAAQRLGRRLNVDASAVQLLRPTRGAWLGTGAGGHGFPR